jgi:hypothetical protein
MQHSSGPEMTRGAEYYASKVPEVTLGFWVIKILATTLGETGGDTVTMTWLKADVMVNTGYLVGSAIFLSAHVCLLVKRTPHAEALDFTLCQKTLCQKRTRNRAGALGRAGARSVRPSPPSRSDT